MAQAECPSCDSIVKLAGTPKMGQRVTCGVCDTELEVVWLDPVELDWAEFDDDGDFGEFDDLDDDEDF